MAKYFNTHYFALGQLLDKCGIKLPFSIKINISSNIPAQMLEFSQKDKQLLIHNQIIFNRPSLVYFPVPDILNLLKSDNSIQKHGYLPKYQ